MKIHNLQKPKWGSKWKTITTYIDEEGEVLDHKEAKRNYTIIKTNRYAVKHKQHYGGIIEIIYTCERNRQRKLDF